VEFMSSGACVPIALEKTNAVADFRTLIGATDPKDAVANLLVLEQIVADAGV